jgi:NTP pyrophosphatase (non-canonical NTP hydrolase)
MQEVVTAPVDPTAYPFVDRRQGGPGRREGAERRQFVDSRSSFRPEVVELAEAVDRYKLRHRRRFITFEELFDVMAELGYHK